MKIDLSSIRKFLVALAGVIAVVLSENLAHGQAAHILSVASTVLAALLVYLVPNGSSPAPPTPPPPAAG